MQNFYQLTADPGHDSYYSVDSNMVISYIANDIPGWREYVDHMSRKGKRFFITNVIHQEVSRKNPILPPAFHLFNDTEGETRAKRALATLLNAFGIPEDASSARKFSNDLQWLLQSGYSISGCPDIPELCILSGKALAITTNAKLVRRFLYNPAQHTAFETVVDECALEHLADVRTVGCNGTFADRSAF